MAIEAKKSSDFTDREFPMTNTDYRKICDQSYHLTGIKLSEHKKNMVYGRLARRLRELDLDSFSAYCNEISHPDSPEIPKFINAITTNLTAFFREFHHFEYLKSTVIPSLLKKNSATKRIRVWSAGCSTGEESYSIAMVLRQCAALSQWDVKVLATDLDSNVVERARSGIYTAERAQNIPDDYSRYFKINKAGDQVKIREDLAELITFKQLNLLHEWPMKGPFDVIFCRNVVIYFDMPTQKVLFDRYANLMASDGHLFIGHSENLHNISTRFDSKGRTIYQRAN